MLANHTTVRPSIVRQKTIPIIKGPKIKKKVQNNLMQETNGQNTLRTTNMIDMNQRQPLIYRLLASDTYFKNDAGLSMFVNAQSYPGTEQTIKISCKRLS